jgi:transcriptional regulator with PAS, ATPase and Fis domain
MKDVVIKINKKYGLHIRLAAAMISTLQQHVKSSEELRHLWIDYRGRRAQLGNLLSIVSLRIPAKAEFRLFCDKEEAAPLVDAVVKFFQEQAEEEEADEEADQLLIESSVSMEAAMSSMRHGVLVVNEDNRITYVNEAASHLIGKTESQLLYHRASETVPGSKMHDVLTKGEAQWNVRQKINNRQIITNRAPIFFDEKIIGAVATFEDISSIEAVSSELESVKLLQEQLQLLLSTINDAIVFIDESRALVYENRAFTQLKAEPEAILSRAEWEALTRQTPLKKSFEDRNGNFHVLKAEPVYVGDKFKGAVFSFTAVREMKDLLQELPGFEVRPSSRVEEVAFQTLTGKSRALQETIKKAVKASATDSTIFISGESGTGKELLAKGIHQASPRRLKPFIALNCAAIPATLLESELFGHEKGSFTNAHRTHIGAFEQAEGGTLFLDEISELHPAVQSKLLRVLQEREVVRVGGRERIPVNIRIISATNQRPETLLESSSFRKDLYYRLYVVPLEMKPLRERPEDIPTLAKNYLTYYAAMFQRPLHSVSPAFYEEVQNYTWPGNIRELKNGMERIMALNDSGEITEADLQFTSRQEAVPEAQTLQEAEVAMIRRTAPFCRNYSQLGRKLGVSRKTAARKLKEYELEDYLGQNVQETGP